ncbi:hypothetical protein FGADI_6783 [Fusarium gaditjirri]|uniref:Uncharacterized protein n=1 Tax=Fusarium gaditjirri TaxID=282569 RepID=A0A8H4T6X2_9HYPO|nr:hypothetical protein FGADI_6783 [Fusarium gaditjirri]
MDRDNNDNKNREARFPLVILVSSPPLLSQSLRTAENGTKQSVSKQRMCIFYAAWVRLDTDNNAIVPWGVLLFASLSRPLRVQKGAQPTADAPATKKKPRLFCSYCKKANHTVDTCRTVPGTITIIGGGAQMAPTGCSFRIATG